MSARDELLLSLLSRLAWPASAVAERAADAVVGLLLDKQTRALVQEGLLTWIHAQRLESVAVLGMLPLVRARDLDSGFVPPNTDRLAAAVARPSILSHMLIEDLAGVSRARPDWSQMHSQDAPDGFAPSAFFTKYVTAFLAPIYTRRATMIESRELLSFARQWSFECQRLLDEIGIRESREAFGFRGREHEEHNGSFNTVLSQVYRSGYLRALAWAAARGRPGEGTIRYLASETCPVNLDLWRVRLTSQPPWWPQPSEPTGALDTVPSAVWRAVSEAWTAQRESASPRVVVRAGGRVFEGKATYDLEIFGAFQRTVGSSEPAAADIAEMLSTISVPSSPSRLRFASGIGWVDPGAVETEFDDWTVIPASARTRPASSMHWQNWRGWHGVTLPMPYLLGRGASFKCTEDGVEVLAGGRAVATWRDWSFRRRDVDVGDLTPSTGFSLEVEREFVKKLSAETRSAFCWVCRLTGYQREHSYRPHEAFWDHRIFGEQRLILPL